MTAMDAWAIAGIGVVFVVLGALLFAGTRESLDDSNGLTQLWREYARRHGDRVIEPERMQVMMN
jgi:hypothetical protein